MTSSFRAAPFLNARRTVGAFAIATVMVAAFLAPSASAQAESVSPDAAQACTTGAYTATSYTIYGIVVDLRMSSSCSGTTWFRFNNAWCGCANGTIQIQYKSGTGQLGNGPSASFDQSPYISPTASGWKQARLIFTNLAGPQASFTSPFFSVPIQAIVR